MCPLFFILLGFTISFAHCADPVSQAAIAQQGKATVYKGAVSVELPDGWTVYEDARVGPLATKAVKIGFLSMLEADPKIVINETFLLAYLQEHTGSKDVERLPDGHFLASSVVDPDSMEQRWHIVKAMSARNFAVAIFTNFVSGADAIGDKKVLKLVRSARFTPLSLSKPAPANLPAKPAAKPM